MAEQSTGQEPVKVGTKVIVKDKGWKGTIRWAARHSSTIIYYHVLAHSMHLIL